MTKSIFLFKLLFISIITLFICSCTPRSKTNEDTQKDTTSAHTYTYTPSINVDSLAATIDTSSYSNMNRDNEDDEETDDVEDDEGYDEDGFDEDYDPYSQRTCHATATYYEYDGLGGRIRHDVNVDVDV